MCVCAGFTKHKNCVCPLTRISLVNPGGKRGWGHKKRDLQENKEKIEVGIAISKDQDKEKSHNI